MFFKLSVSLSHFPRGNYGSSIQGFTKNPSPLLFLFPKGKCYDALHLLRGPLIYKREQTDEASAFLGLLRCNTRIIASGNFHPVFMKHLILGQIKYDGSTWTVRTNA